MEIKHGLISCDDHAQLDRDNWLNRMSKAKWGDAIPHLIETKDPKDIVPDTQPAGYDLSKGVHRWLVNGKVIGERAVTNAPAVMGDPMRKWYPQRWEDVPAKVYDPYERVKAMDVEGVDAAVLFPNDPVQGGTFFQGDAQFELACIQAYNDGLADWGQASKGRLIPLALVPLMGGIEETVGEVERSVRAGHKGMTMLAEPNQSNSALHHFNDPYWYPLWKACESLDIPVHWHGGGGLRLNTIQWKGFTRWEQQAAGLPGGFSSCAQFIPNLIFSGILDKYPALQWVCAETGLGWVNYIIEGCDHEWERRHLWTEGINDRPSDLFHRQMWVDFWYEKTGIEMRHSIGIDHIMWESDFPHSTSTYGQSWEFVNRTLVGVPEHERKQLLYGNGVKLYKL